MKRILNKIVIANNLLETTLLQNLDQLIQTSHKTQKYLNILPPMIIKLKVKIALPRVRAGRIQKVENIAKSEAKAQ